MHRESDRGLRHPAKLTLVEPVKHPSHLEETQLTELFDEARERVVVAQLNGVPDFVLHRLLAARALSVLGVHGCARYRVPTQPPDARPSASAGPALRRAQEALAVGL